MKCIIIADEPCQGHDGNEDLYDLYSRTNGWTSDTVKPFGFPCRTWPGPDGKPMVLVFPETDIGPETGNDYGKKCEVIRRFVQADDTDAVCWIIHGVELADIIARHASLRHDCVARLTHDNGDPLYVATRDFIDRPKLDRLQQLISAALDKRYPVRRLSILKHDISNLLLPMDSDLQGMLEIAIVDRTRVAHVDSDYCREVLSAHAPGEGQCLLSATRGKLYRAEGDANIESVSRVVRDVLAPGPAGLMVALRALLPEKDDDPVLAAPKESRDGLRALRDTIGRARQTLGPSIADAVNWDDENEALQQMRLVYMRARDALDAIDLPVDQRQEALCACLEKNLDAFHIWYALLVDLLDAMRDSTRRPGERRQL